MRNLDRVERIGFVGLGFISPLHARAVRLALPGCEIMGVDSNPSASDRALQSGIVDHTGDLDELIAWRPNAVHILTPATGHFSVAESLLECGIDVLIEKPMAVSVADCELLETSAQRSGAILAVSHSQLFAPAWEKTRAVLASGALGELRSVDIAARAPLGLPDPSATSLPWMFRSPVNLVLEVGSHALSTALDAAGALTVLGAHAGDPWQRGERQAVYRQWDISARAHSPSGRDVSVHVALGYDEGLEEYRINLQGTLGAAGADLVRGTTWFTAAGVGDAPLNHAREALTHGLDTAFSGGMAYARFASGRLGRRSAGDPYADSLARSVAEFHAARASRTIDKRHSASMGCQVVKLAHDVASVAGLGTADETPVVASPAPRPSGSNRLTNRVVVVGGTGFIGNNLVRELVASERLTVVARDVNRAQMQFAGLDVEVVPGDVTDPQSIIGHVPPGARVFHLALPRTEGFNEAKARDIAPSLELARLCSEREVDRFVYTSTIAMYDLHKPDRVITETSKFSEAILRTNAYAYAKASTEQGLLALHVDQGFPVVIARPAIVLGPGADPRHWGIAEWPRAGIARLRGPASGLLPLVHVTDVVKALHRASQANDAVGEAFNLSGPSLVSAHDYIAEVAAVLGTPVRIVEPRHSAAFTGQLAKWGVAVMRREPRGLPTWSEVTGGSNRSTFDCSKARSILGFAPSTDAKTVLADCATDTARWWRDHR